MAASLSFGQTAFFGLAGYTYGILTHQFRRDLRLHARWRSCSPWLYRRAVRRGARLFPDLRPDQRRLPRHRHALGDAGVRSASWPRPPGRNGGSARARLNGYNGMTGMPPLTIPWFDGDIVLFPDVAALLLRCLALLVAGLSRPAHAGELAVRQRAGGDPREPGARRDAGLRHPQIPARRLRHRQRAGRAERRRSTPPGASTSRRPAWA